MMDNDIQFFSNSSLYKHMHIYLYAITTSSKLIYFIILDMNLSVLILHPLAVYWFLNDTFIAFYIY